MNRISNYKEFIHSLNNIDFTNPDPLINLGLTESMAKKILTAYGLRWFDGGWTGSPSQIANEYLFPHVEKLWADLQRPKTVLDHASVVSFIAIRSSV